MKPKFIKNANCWLVAVPIITSKGKRGQQFNWFESETEALQFIKDNEKNN